MNIGNTYNLNLNNNHNYNHKLDNKNHNKQKIVNKKQKSTLRQMMELNNQQNTGDNDNILLDQNISKTDHKVYTLRMKDNYTVDQSNQYANIHNPHKEIITNNKNSKSLFSDDKKIKTKRTSLLNLEPNHQKYSKNSFTNISDQNLYQLLQHHHQNQPQIENNCYQPQQNYYQQQPQQINQDYYHNATHQQSNNIKKYDKKRIPLLKINNHQNTKVIKQRQNLIQLKITPSKKQFSPFNKKQYQNINLSPLRRNNEKRSTTPKTFTSKPIINGGSKNINKLSFKTNQSNSNYSNINLFDSKELTFKAIQKNPAKKFRFSEIARQYINKNQDTQLSINNQDNSYGEAKRSNFNSNKNIPLPFKNVSNRNSFNKISISNDYLIQQENYLERMKTPGKQRNHSNNVQIYAQSNNNLQYDFPQCYSPSPNRSKKGTPSKSKQFNQKCDLKLQLSPRNRSISNIEQSLKNFEIPAEYKNQITKGQFDKLNKEFQNIKKMVIDKIQDQYLQKNKSKMNKNKKSNNKHFSVQKILATLSQTIFKVLDSCIEKDKTSEQTQNFLRQSIRQSLRNFNTNFRQQKHQIIKQEYQFHINQQQCQLNQNFFSFEGNSNPQFKLSEEEIKGIQHKDILENQCVKQIYQQIKSEDKKDSSIFGKEIKLQRRKSQKLQQEEGIIAPHFQSDSSISSMGIPALLESLQVPQSKMPLVNSGNIKKTKQNLENKNNFLKIPFVVSQNKIDLENTLRNQLSLQSVQQACPNSEIQQSIEKRNKNISVSVQPFGISKACENSNQSIQKDNKAGVNCQISEQKKEIFLKKQFKPYLENRIFKKNTEQKCENDNHFQIKYGLKYLQKKSNYTEVIRISPIKLRKKQQIMQNLLQKRIINKQSSSIIYE